MLTETETVLAEKNKTRANDTKLEKVVEQMEQQNLSLANTLKSRLGEVGALATKVIQAHLRRWWKQAARRGQCVLLLQIAGPFHSGLPEEEGG